jgi:hypothetical protein
LPGEAPERVERAQLGDELVDLLPGQGQDGTMTEVAWTKVESRGRLSADRRLSRNVIVAYNCSRGDA